MRERMSENVREKVRIKSGILTLISSVADLKSVIGGPE